MKKITTSFIILLVASCFSVIVVIFIFLRTGYVKLSAAQSPPSLALKSHELYACSAMNHYCWQQWFKPHGDLIYVRDMELRFDGSGVSMIDAPNSWNCYYVWGGNYRFPRGNKVTIDPQVSG